MVAVGVSVGVFVGVLVGVIVGVIVVSVGGGVFNVVYMISLYFSMVLIFLTASAFDHCVIVLLFWDV